MLPLDPHPGDLQAFANICAAAPFRGAARVWTDGRVSLAALGGARHAVPTHPDGSPIAVVFDGRLDNRRELAARLRLADGDRLSDADVVRHAYARWGSDCAPLLLGDFALVVWDAPNRELFCARDPLGVRPLYYTAAPGRLVLGSDLLHMLAAYPQPPPPNEGMVAEYLSGSVRSRDETVYTGINRVPGGCWLRAASDGGVVRGRYWRPGDGAELRYASDVHYADAFRDVFLEAVRCRLPRDEPAGIYLSGGIDSAAVTAAACAVAPAVPPIAFSLAFGEDPEIHERRYMRDVSAWCGIENVVTLADDRADHVPPVFSRDPADWQRDLAAHSWKRAIRASGITVALTGNGGDDTFLGSQFHYADLLRRGRVRAACRQWREDPAVLEAPASVRAFIQFGLWPLLPAGVRALASPLARRVTGEAPRQFPWLDPDFSRRASLPERLHEPYQRRSTSSARDAIVRAGFEFSGKEIRLETAEREATEHGIDERHPFLDRRVVEFGLRLPDDQRWRGDLTRFVVRNALREGLPPSIRTRRSAGDGSARLVTAVTAMGAGDLVRNLAIARCGWVRADVVQGLYARMQTAAAAGDPAYIDAAHPLWMICATELWFRASYGPRGAILPEVTPRS